MGFILALKAQSAANGLKSLISILCILTRIIMTQPRCWAASGFHRGQQHLLRSHVAYVWIGEGLYDKDYVAEHTHGFEAWQAYVVGTEDGVAKTPEWRKQKQACLQKIYAPLPASGEPEKPISQWAVWATPLAVRLAIHRQSVAADDGVSYGHAGAGQARYQYGQYADGRAA